MEVESFKALVERERPSKYLPYFSYDEDTGVYILKDGGVGILFEADPVHGIWSKTYEALHTVLGDLPPGSSIQFIFLASPDITKLLDLWEAETVVPGLLEEVTKNYKQFVEEKAWEPIGNVFYSPARDFKLLISVKIGGKQKEYSPFEFLKSFEKLKEEFLRVIRFGNGKRKEEDDLKQKIMKLVEVREKIKGNLVSGGIFAEEVSPQRFIEIMYPVLNPSHDYREIPRWDGFDLSEKVISNDTLVSIYDDYVILDGIYLKSLAFKDYPEEFSFADTINYIGNVITNDSIPVPFILVLNVIKLDEKVKSKVKRNAAIVMNQQLPYALFPRLKQKHQDLSYSLERIEKGEDIYHVNLSVIVFAKTKEELKKGAGYIKTHFKSLGFRLEEDKYINFIAFLADLPFGTDIKVADFLSRGRAVFGENAADLAPVVGDWKGNGSAVLLFSTRGQVVGFDLFNSPSGGFNAFVVGMTGSGKSVLLQWIALSYLRRGDRVWIIDIGRSYERLAHIFGGEFIELKLEKPISLNPFSHIKDEAMLDEYMEFLKDLYFMMGAPKEITLSQELEKLIKAYLEEAIRETYRKYGQESGVDTLIEELRTVNDARVQDFVKVLTMYSSLGQYGPFFNGTSEISFNAPLVVLENDTIENLADLRDPAIMLLTFHISKEIYLSHSSNRNLVIIDEAHKFLGNPRIDLFIEQAYRRFRKHGASIILGTQGFEDFYGGEKISRAGRVIVQNSVWKFFMMQTATSRQALKKSGYFSFTPYEEELLDSVRTVKGEYSEVFLVSEMGSAKLRLVLDDFLKALFFTDAEVRRAIQELVNKGYTWTEAVKKVQEEMQ